MPSHIDITAPDRTSPAPFTTLPYEIRAQIFRYAIPNLTATWCDYSCNVPPDHNLTASDLHNSIFTLHGGRKSLPRFMFTNRLFLSEAKPILMAFLALHLEWRVPGFPDHRLWHIRKKDQGFDGNIKFSAQDLAQVRTVWAYPVFKEVYFVRRAIQRFCPGVKWFHVRQGWCQSDVADADEDSNVVHLDAGRYPSRDAISDQDMMQFATERLGRLHDHFRRRLGFADVDADSESESEVGVQRHPRGDEMNAPLNDFESLLSCMPGMRCIMELELLLGDDTQDRLGVNHVEISYEWRDSSTDFYASSDTDLGTSTAGTDHGSKPHRSPKTSKPGGRRAGRVFGARLVDDQFWGCRWPAWHDPNHHRFTPF